MKLSELELDLPVDLRRRNSLAQVKDALKFRLPESIRPLRFAITRSDGARVNCLLSGLERQATTESGESIFELRLRSHERTSQFNVVLLVPTGIGADIGGHAGDAAPVARLIAEACDNLILHPNVVNASDINEMPTNSLYVEGSVVTRLLLGTIGLVPVRSNRVLLVLSEHEDELFLSAAINAVGAARASLGMQCPYVLKLVAPLTMRADFTNVGTAAGEIGGLGELFAVLEARREDYDALAISSVISVPKEFHQTYFNSAGEMVNPWGGVEAMLTHAISDRFNVPSAHSPMLENRDVANQDHGIVDPRMAAEAVSLTFLHSVLKGLHKSPRIVTDYSQLDDAGVISAADISCLVIPDGCLGLPTLAALEQGIPVIAVKENKNLMDNDLTVLPWRPNQFHMVNNYWEAVGVLCALGAGIAPESVRRPIHATKVSARALQDIQPAVQHAGETSRSRANR